MENSISTAYLCFLVVAKQLNISVPPKSAEKFTNNLSSDDIEKNLLILAKSLNLKSRFGAIKYNKLKRITNPVIAQKKDGNYIFILMYRDNQWTILDPLKKVPETVSDEELRELITGHILIFGKKGLSAEDTQVFGFKWFIPTILKFKKQFICVLIAVFTVQIIGILTPLMTQVVVDKVLSHHALSTLTTIAIGITIAYIYELLISLSKNNLFTHTTNRIIRIEDAAVNVDGLGNVYQVDVRLDDVPREFLKVGQEGSCDISIGERTILNYFMEPFIDGLKESMHER